jgi:hypothetical protein
MKRKRWQDQQGHPPADLLLLHIEGELERSDATQLSLHLAQCPSCRQLCAQLELGGSQFAAFQQSVVLPEAALRLGALQESLRAAQNARSSGSLATRLRALFTFHSGPRFALGTASALIALIAGLSWYLGTPRQSVYASQILADAVHASDAMTAKSKVLHQKVRLQRGNLIIERNVHHGRSTAQQAKEPSIDAQFQHALDLAHINLDDPLNANDFAAWRAAEPRRNDKVNGTAQSVTISTRVKGEEIAESSLTLSRSDWRPIARSVEFRGETPIEISEESYDISDVAGSSPDLAAHGLAASPVPSPNSSSATGVSIDELETSEIDLREALNGLGAEASANARIWRADDEVYYQSDATDPGLLQKLKLAARSIPHVTPGTEKSAPLPGEDHAVSGSSPYPPNPASELEARLGGPQQAGEFLETLRGRYTRAIAEAAALDKLGKRYPLETMKRLPPDLQTRVNNLAATMLSALQHDSAEYIKTLSPVMDDFAQEHRVAAAGDDAANVPGCLHWQENAALAEPRLLSLGETTSRLLARGQTLVPEPAETEQLIGESLAARSFLQRHLMSTCQVFGSN